MLEDVLTSTSDTSFSSGFHLPTGIGPRFVTFDES
jgi:hypothetical protein